MQGHRNPEMSTVSHHHQLNKRQAAWDDRDCSPPCPVSLLLQTSLCQSQNQRSGPNPKTSFDPSPTVNIPQGSNNTRNSQAGDHLQRSRCQGWNICISQCWFDVPCELWICCGLKKAYVQMITMYAVTLYRKKGIWLTLAPREMLWSIFLGFIQSFNFKLVLKC